MDDAPAGIRLRVRQATLRPAARGARAPGARAPVRGARLPGPPRAVPGKPRRAAGRCNVFPQDARGRSHRHVSVTRSAILPPGAVRWPSEADLAAPRPRPAGDRRREIAAVLRPPSGGRATPDLSRGRLAVARVCTSLGRQLDERLLRGVVVGNARPATMAD